MTLINNNGVGISQATLSDNIKGNSNFMDCLDTYQLDVSGDGEYDLTNTAGIGDEIPTSLSEFAPADQLSQTDNKSDTYYEGLVTEVIDNMADQGFDVDSSELTKVLSEAIKLLV